jgi:prepilin peptidase CpaA
MFVFIFTLFPVLASLVIAGLCALSDFRRLRIPNEYVLITLGLFVFAQIIAYAFDSAATILPSLTSSLLAALIIFALSALLFALRFMGAGDSKMMTVYALFFGLGNILIFLFYMATFGALLGISTLLLGKYKPFKSPREGSWIFFAQNGDKTKVPYGISILAGIVLAYANAGLLSPQTFLSLLSR